MEGGDEHQRELARRRPPGAISCQFSSLGSLHEAAATLGAPGRWRELNDALILITGSHGK